MKIGISKNDKLINEYEILAGKVYTVGKALDNDIIIDDEAISDYHLDLELNADNTVKFIKKDPFSFVFMGDKNLDEGVLAKGSVLNIGEILIYLIKSSDKTSFTINFFNKNDEVSVLDNKENLSTDEKVEDTAQAKISEPQVLEEVFSETNATMVGTLNLFFKLEAISGPFQGRNFILDKAEYTAGRNPENDIVLVDDLVSRYHASFKNILNTYEVSDLGSSNGVVVNGVKISSAFKLSSGDLVEVGSTIFRFIVINKQQENLKAEPLRGTKASSLRESPIQEVPSDTQIRRVELSFGKNEDSETKKKNFLKPLIIIIIALASFYYYTEVYSNKDESNEAEKLLETVKTTVEEPVITENEQQLLDPAFEGLPIGVQRQLVSEYDIGVRLFENGQFELCEDRARQILSKAPNWEKADELLELCLSSKEKIIEQKKEESEEEIRRLLEEDSKKFLKQANRAYKGKDYETAKELYAKVLELDANNAQAQEMLKRIESLEKTKEEGIAKKRKVDSIYYDLEKKFQDAENLFKKQNYRLASEHYKKLTKISTYGDSRIKEITSKSHNRLKECLETINAQIEPELSLADELFNSGQFKQAIDYYKRILSVDYTNNQAKQKIKQCEDAINQDVSDIYKRAIISESVSDMENACLLFNLVIDKAIVGSRYHSLSKQKVYKNCR